jgi:hypothetical protein
MPKRRGEKARPSLPFGQTRGHPARQVDRGTSVGVVAPRKHWVDFYTPETWRDSSETTHHEVGGFRLNRESAAARVAIGDYLFCYVSEIAKFVGVVETLSLMDINHKRLWDETWPIRFDTKLLWKVENRSGLPLRAVLDHVGYTRTPRSYVVPTLQQLHRRDAEYILRWFEGMDSQGATVTRPSHVTA